MQKIKIWYGTKEPPTSDYMQCKNLKELQEEIYNREGNLAFSYRNGWINENEITDDFYTIVIDDSTQDASEVTAWLKNCRREYYDVILYKETEKPHKQTIEEKLIDEGYENVIILKNYDYEDALIGITHDNRAVYDYAKMVEWLIQKEKFTEEEAIEWIDYNTIRALPYMGPEHPIIFYPLNFIV